MSDFSPRWVAASSVERHVATAVNHLIGAPVWFSTSTHAEQDMLLNKAMEFIHELKQRGIILIDPNSKEFADQAATAVRKLLGYEEP